MSRGCWRGRYGRRGKREATVGAGVLFNCATYGAVDGLDQGVMIRPAKLRSGVLARHPVVTS